MENTKFVVMGEASESDEENVVISVAEQKSGVVQGVIVAGEATESEDESEESYSEASEAFYSRSGATRNNVDNMEVDTVVIPKYNTLLHKKLRERNALLRRAIREHSRQCLTNASRMLNTTNQQLLASQVELQDAAAALRKAVNNLNKIDASLETIVLTSYLPSINITG